MLNLDGGTRELTFYIETDAASTASVELHTARSSAGPWVTLGSSQAIDAASAVTLSFTGTYLTITPRLIAINSTANRVYVEVVGN